MDEVVDAARSVVHNCCLLGSLGNAAMRLRVVVICRSHIRMRGCTCVWSRMVWLRRAY